MRELNTAHSKLPLRIPALNDITPIILLVLSSRAGTLGMFPFGIAFFAAVFDKSIAYIGVAAICAGLAASSGAALIPKYLIAAIAYWLFTRLSKTTNDIIKSAACASSVLIGGAVMLIIIPSSVYDVFLLLTESIICALMYVVFIKSSLLNEDYSKRGRTSQEEYISSAIAIGVFITGLDGIEIGIINLKNIFASYTVLITALNASIAVSGCTGLCLGFMTTLTGTESLVMMGVYGLSALFSSFMNNFKKLGCVIGYTGGMLVSLLYIKSVQELPVSIADVLISSVLFLVTPKIMHEYFRSFFIKSVRIETVSPDLRMREYLSMRLRDAGDAFSGLYESFMAVSESRLNKYNDDVSEILDDAADRVCNNCRMCGKCWQTEFRRTYKNILELITIIEKQGELTMDNIPEKFCEKCIRSRQFISEINHVYELYKRDTMRKSDAITTRNLISMQYNEINAMLSEMADEIDDGFTFLESEEEKIVDELDKAGIDPYELSVVEGKSGDCEIYLRLPPGSKHSVVEGIISQVLNRPIGEESTDGKLTKYISKANYCVDKSVLQLEKSGSAANGDSAAMFTTGKNKFYAILADGMGSGANAQYESMATIRLLTRFLKAGFSPKTALCMLNTAMCVNINNESYSTVDLLSIDLYTGTAEFYKIGSAESVILNSDEITVLRSSSTPIGILSEIRLNNNIIQLHEGDIIALMSDGITQAGYSASRTDWIKNIVIKPFNSMEQMAEEIMNTALKKSKGIAKDDMTVIAIRIMSC